MGCTQGTALYADSRNRIRAISSLFDGLAVTQRRGAAVGGWERAGQEKDQDQHFYLWLASGPAGGLQLGRPWRPWRYWGRRYGGPRGVAVQRAVLLAVVTDTWSP